MSFLKATGIALMSLLTMPTALRAQLCTGTASYRAGALAIGAGAERADDATLVRAQLGFGKAGGGFVSASAGRASFEGTSVNSTLVGGHIGFEIPLTVDDRLAVCPIVGTSHESSDDGVVRAATFAVGVGLSVGRELPISTRASVIPFAHVALVRTRLTLSDVDDRITLTDVHGELRAGVGLVLNRSLTLQPTVGIRFGETYGKPAFGIAVQVNFGGGR